MIVVAGEALIDLIVGANGELAAIPGGGPYNTARSIARLGQPVAFLGRISTDRFGRALLSKLAGDGVASHGVVETDDPTTLAVVELDEEGVARYRFYVDGTSAPGLTDADARRVLAGSTATVAALHVGTLGLVMEPIGTTIERLVVEADPGWLVMLDPNCRPSATPDPAAFRARIDRVAGRADVVKVSDDDLRFLAPDADPDATIDRLLGLGVRVVLLTHGSDDVEIRMRSGLASVPVPTVDVVDTVGAGDAFAGGFLAAWVGAGRGRDDLESIDLVCESVRVAVRVAALSCTRAGADPPTLAELEAFPG
jgi:fructokinase